MGQVQQAVLEFDEEVRAPWRPRLVAGTGREPEALRRPSHHTPSRVSVCEAPGGRGVPAPRRTGSAPDRLSRAATSAAPCPPDRRRAVAPAPRRRARIRPTRRARRLALFLAVAAGVLLGSWIGPMVEDGGELRLAGESSLVVRQGDTLWSIASSVAGAERDVRSVVDAIQRLNELPDSDLRPGQVLQLP